MSAEGYAAAAELFRHRLLHALREAKLISPGKLADLLSWQHSGWRILRQSVRGASRPVNFSHPPRAPFSLQKITWKPETQTVIYRSKPHHNTKRNFEIFKAADFIAAIVDHIPPKSKHTVRYYGKTFEPITPPERAIKEWVPDDELPDLWDQTAGFSNDWDQSRPNPKLGEVDLGDGRILVPCFD